MSPEDYERDNADINACIVAMLACASGRSPEIVVNAALHVFCAMLRADGADKQTAMQLVSVAYDEEAAKVWEARVRRGLRELS